jgi:predicted N-formylglutamate amidohydrolase
MTMAASLATTLQDWPAPFELVNAAGRSPVVLVCEHASNHIPSEYRGLGLAPEHLERHIAWDRGAASLTRRLAALLDSAALLGTYSRLLIDLNRPPDAPGSIPTVSERTAIPGNVDLAAEEKERRIASIFTPFQDRLGDLIGQRESDYQPPILVSIHSFNPTFCGEVRPMHAGILYERAADLGANLVGRLAADPALVVRSNEPYAVARDEDYALLVHGDDRGVPAVLVEIRNDGLETEPGVETWAKRLAEALAPEIAAAIERKRRTEPEG